MPDATSLHHCSRTIINTVLFFLLPDCAPGCSSEGTEPLRLPRDDPADGGGIPITIQDDETFIFPLVFKLLENTK